MLTLQQNAVRLAIAAMLAASILIPTEAWAVPRYSITSLGPVGGPGAFSGTLRAINNDGWVIGSAKLEGTDIYRGFLWKPNAGWSDLGTLGGPESHVSIMNDEGWIVGTSQTNAGTLHTCLWHGQGGIEDLGVFGGISSTANGINNRGQIVGTYRTDELADAVPYYHQQWRGFLWDANNGMSDIGMPPEIGATGWPWDNVSAQAISDKGHIAASATEVFGYGFYLHTIWLKDHDGWSRIEARPTGGGCVPRVQDVNNWGQVVGHYSDKEGSAAFLWQRESWTPIGDFGGGKSSAWAINNRGQVVGNALDADGHSHAYLWERGEILDLNDYIPPESGWELSQADDINDHGQILTYGKDSEGNHSACVLTPDVEPRQPQFHAVLIGVSDPPTVAFYKRTRGDKDAQAIYSALADLPGMNPSNLWLLNDPSDVNQVRNVIQRASEDFHAGDTFLFYYSGHGYMSPDATHEEPPVDVSILARGGVPEEWWTHTYDEYVAVGDDGISDDMLTEWLSPGNENLRNIHVMVVLDSCFTGGFWGQAGNDADEGDLDKLTDAALLAAASEGGLSFCNPLTGRGWFSYLLEDALTRDLLGNIHADENGDGGVSFRELRDYMDVLYNDYWGETGLIKGLPWLEHPVELEAEQLSLYSAEGINFDPQRLIVPEPATLALLAVGGLGIALRRRRAGAA